MQFDNNLFSLVGLDNSSVRLNQVEAWPINFKLAIKYEILYSRQL